jgi:MSHA biogenesis protein MshO
VADTAVRRMARDVRKALPNSLRPTTGGSCIEFIPTKTGGRYRADDTASGLGFDVADTSFNMLGSNAALPASQQIGRGDWIVVYNLGIPSSDAYAADSVLVPNNRTQVSATAPIPLTEPSGTGETTIPVDSKLFPLASGSKRFHVVDAAEQTLTYVCTGVGTTAGEGSGILYRYARNFSATHTCPTSLAGVAGASELARNISACNFVYNGSDLQRNATVQVNLSITRAGEAVSLYHEVHVNNTP